MLINVKLPRIYSIIYIIFDIIEMISFQAGMHAVRENRYVVLTKDFDKAYKSVIKKDQNDFEFYK